MSSTTEQSLIEEKQHGSSCLQYYFWYCFPEEIMLSQIAHFMVQILERQMNKGPVCVSVCVCWGAVMSSFLLLLALHASW